MRRLNQTGPWQQLPLALNPLEDAESMPVLRAAYCRLKLSRRLTFEQAMAYRALAIGVRHLAHAIVRGKDKVGAESGQSAAMAEESQ